MEGPVTGKRGAGAKKDESRDEERSAAGEDDERQEEGRERPGSGEGFGMGMHDARSEITGFAEPAIMAL